MTARRIEIYDTTLRDGTQGEGINLSLEDKLQIAQKLDQFGVDYIEGGYPLSNPKDAAFFREVQTLGLQQAKVAAFGMTRRRGVEAHADPGMRALLEAQTEVITIVGKTSPWQVENVLSVTLEENLKMIADTIGFMVSEGKRVFYDAEHFFDSFRSDPAYALQTLKVARDAGAQVLCLCDTNGGSMPEDVEKATQTALELCNSGVTIGVHTHNDSGVALANALASVRVGANLVQGTINGLGERCGNMDLIPLVANLRLKYKYDCLQPDSLSSLTEVSNFVYETANLNLHNGQPYVGSSAFAHKGGMHVHAVQKNVSTYEHVQPEAVGNTRKILVSELSGISNISTKMGKKFNLEQDKTALRKALIMVQDMENVGYQFEAAEASFELLLRKQIGKYHQFFDLDHYRIVMLKTNGNEPISEASVKLHINGQLEHRVAEGDGPVNALDAALRRALIHHLPAIADVHLVDYKVRVINSREQTAATVRVVIESKRKSRSGKLETFGTIGVSSNVIDASWQALVDACEYHLLRVEEEADASQGAAV